MRGCGARAVIGGRKMICRAPLGHKSDHAWGTLRARKTKPNLEIAARASDLIVSLPEGDYTKQVKRLYINGRTVMIEFNTSDPNVLRAKRERYDG